MLSKLYDKILATQVLAMVGVSSLMANGETFADRIEKQAKPFEKLVGNGKGEMGLFTMLLIAGIFILGIVFLYMGAHKAFIADDRGAEGNKSKGFLMIVGGIFCIALGSIVKWVQGN